MKTKRTKALAFLASLCLILGFAACGDKPNGNDSSPLDSSPIVESSSPTQENSSTPEEPELTPSEGLEYTLSDNGTYYIVSKGTCIDVDIVIPSTYKNKPVKAIGDYAFSSCAPLQNVTIPDSVQSIGDFAFAYCESLQRITIPDSVQYIGEKAFTLCESLTSIEVATENTAYQSIDGNLYTKGGKALVQYAIGKSATSFIIPDSVQSIGDSAFAYCESLQSVIIPDSVQSIGDSAFFSCGSLQSVIIPDSVQSIGEEAFFKCRSLQSVTIPDSVQSIGDWAFSGCESLTSIEVATENTAYQSIDGNLYTKGGKALVQYAIGKSATSFIIPDSVQSIGDAAFESCDSLQSVTIPDSVQSIGQQAFGYCRSLQSVIIGNSVQSIGYAAFTWCDSLTEVTFENTEGWYVTEEENATSGWDISSADLANKETAATYLTDTYCDYYWYRKD